MLPNFESKNVNVFSRLFLCVSVTFQILQQNIKYSVAGLVWYDERESTNPLPRKLVISAAVVFILLSLLLVVQVQRAMVKTANIREQAALLIHDTQFLPSLLGVPRGFSSYQSPLKMADANQESFGPPWSIGLRPWQALVRIFSQERWIPALSILLKLAVPCVYIGLTIWLLDTVLLCALVILWVVCLYLFEYALEITTSDHRAPRIYAHVHLVHASNWLLRYSTTLIEKLFGQVTNADEEYMLNGFISPRNDYQIDGGSMVSKDAHRYLFSNIGLYAGNSLSEVVVYVNKVSIIRIDTTRSKLGDIEMLTSVIKHHIGEDNAFESLTIGTIPWTYAMLVFLDGYLGPGPWPGVESLEHSLIWLALVTAVAKLINSSAVIAFIGHPPSRNVTPNKILCQWEDASKTTWTIRSDDEGIVHAKVDKKASTSARRPVENSEEETVEREEGPVANGDRSEATDTRVEIAPEVARQVVLQLMPETPDSIEVQ